MAMEELRCCDSSKDLEPLGRMSRSIVMLKFPGASRKTIPMQEVRQNDAVILACDVTAQHLKTGATIMPYGCPNVDRTTSTLQTCLCDVEGFTTMPPESHSSVVHKQTKS